MNLTTPLTYRQHLKILLVCVACSVLLVCGVWVLSVKLSAPYQRHPAAEAARPWLLAGEKTP